jgi:hypothetical protein
MADKKETVSVATTSNRESLDPGFSYNELLNALVKGSTPLLDKQHEVTVEMFVLASGRNEQSCRNELDRKVDNGQLKKHRTIVNSSGRKMNAYYDPTKWQPKEVSIEQSSSTK